MQWDRAHFHLIVPSVILVVRLPAAASLLCIGTSPAPAGPPACQCAPTAARTLSSPRPSAADAEVCVEIFPSWPYDTQSQMLKGQAVGHVPPPDYRFYLPRYCRSTA